MDIIFWFLFRCGVLGVAIFLSSDLGFIAMGFVVYIVASIFEQRDKINNQFERIQKIEKRLIQLSDKQFERTQSLESRLRWAEFKLSNVINRLNDDESNPPDTDPAGQ